MTTTTTTDVAGAGEMTPAEMSRKLDELIVQSRSLNEQILVVQALVVLVVAQRNRYKSALEEISNVGFASQYGKAMEIAREALRGVHQ